MLEKFEFDDITAVILAGGRATRLGGVDKGLQPLHGKPLVAHVLERLHGQAGHILINCNRNAECYAAYGHPIIADRLPDYPGPLAGLHAALSACTTPWLLTVPCDSPYLPLDLSRRLRAALGDAPAACAATPETQPVFALYRRDVLPALETFLAGEQRSVGRWLKQLGSRQADFSDCADTFRNLNSADDWPGC